jgi:hypothetical protein
MLGLERMQEIKNKLQHGFLIDLPMMGKIALFAILAASQLLVLSFRPLFPQSQPLLLAAWHRIETQALLNGIVPLIAIFLVQLLIIPMFLMRRWLGQLAEPGYPGDKVRARAFRMGSYLFGAYLLLQLTIAIDVFFL